MKYYLSDHRVLWRESSNDPISLAEYKVSAPGTWRRSEFVRNIDLRQSRSEFLVACYSPIVRLRPVYKHPVTESEGKRYRVGSNGKVDVYHPSTGWASGVGNFNFVLFMSPTEIDLEWKEP